MLAVGGGLRGTAHVWNVDQAKLVTEYLVGHDSASVAFLPSGELLIGTDNKLMRRERANYTEPVVNRKDRVQSEEIAIDISMASDFMVAGYGRYLADPGEGSVTFYDLRRGKHRLLPGHDGSSVFDVAIDPMGELIVAGGGPRYGPGFVKLWNAHTGMLTAELPKEKACVTSVAVSPHGNRLAVVAYGRVAVWGNFSTQPKLLWRRELAKAFRVAISPHGDVLAVGCFGGEGTQKNPPTVMIWDAETGEQLEIASCDRSIMDLAFSPDGRLLASIDWDGKVEVYDRDQQRTVLSEVAHEPVGYSVAFSPDGRTLATASNNGQISFWHLSTMTHVATLNTRDQVAKLAFFPDGQTLAVGYLDRTIKLWHVDREMEVFSIDVAADRR